MGNEMVVAISPFILSQSIKVYKDNKCVKNVECKLSELESVIVGLALEFNIHKIDLAGAPFAAEKVKRNFMTKYRNYNFEINII